METGLAQKVAVVTGSSTGIGLEIARGLAAEGARVVMSARGRERLEEARAALSAELSTPIAAIPADVGTAEGCAHLIEETRTRFGRIDVLVNNAGGAPGPAGFLNLADEDWQHAWDLNLMSAMRCSRLVIPEMQKQGGGRIVMISSTSAHQPDVVVCHYNAAKAALINLSKTLSNAFAADQILVNCVCPGLTRTPAVEASARVRLAEAGKPADGLSADEAVFAYYGPRRPIPIGRFGTPEEVAAIVVFLCSAQASWITGTCINVDGGWTKTIL
ncbi:MAG: SDR family oxidoreductase [Deltaproteobacteria bacterium]|nr:SDR family oxidoreductase [Deltaproteobacteria bacterium]